MLFVAVCMLLLFPKASAQDWEIGAFVGASGYMGDLNPENPFAYNDAGVALSGKYNLSATWGVRANLSYSRIHADDRHSSVAQRRLRGLNFSGHVAEAALLVDFNFFRFLPQRGRVSYTPYLFAGIGYIDYDSRWTNPEDEWDSYEHSSLTGNNFPLSIPFGAGFKYNLRGQWTIGVEVGYRQTFTDYLDAVSGMQPQNAGNRLEQGDGRPYDSYMTAGFTISYTIFKGGCPEWRN